MGRSRNMVYLGLKTLVCFVEKSFASVNYGQNPDLDLRNFLKNFLRHLIYEMSYYVVGVFVL